MMAAYQPTPGGHPGHPHGHPGMGPNPGQQHMGQPMMQSVSGAPHVSQPGAMMGLQPGAQGMGPGGMGGQHPGGMPMQAQMGAQGMGGGMPHGQGIPHMQQAAMQQQIMQMNPQLAQQQHLMRLRQQQMMAAQANGMMGVQHGGMQMSPAQLQQLQQHQQQQQQHQQNAQSGQSVQLPAHLMMQQQALQHQQQQRMAAQQHNQQFQQQLAMQHANSQQSNQGQPAQPNPQGQPNNPQQMRPQSRMANPNEQAQQGQQQHPQQAQAQQGQPQQQPTPQQGQQQTAQQGQQNQQQPQPAQMTSQQRQQFAMYQQQQRQLQARMAAAQTQNPAQQGGIFILRLMSFCDHLSNFSDVNGKDITNWHQLVERHFAPEGRLMHSFDGGTQAGRGKQFEVLRPNIARYFWTYFDSGASSLKLTFEHARELIHAPSGGQQVSCQHATLSVSYPNGARLESIGTLQALYTPGTDSMECLQFQTTTTDEIISRSYVEKVLTEWSPSLPTKSPKMAKNKLPKAQQKMQEQQDRLTIDQFPKTPKGTYGITSKVQQLLELGETMNIMSDIILCAQEKKLRPEQAMEALLAQHEAQQAQAGGNPQINLPPNGIPQGNRTPNMQNMQMPQNGNFSSPSVSNLSLPMQTNGMNGSPHLGNNPGNLAPGMNMSNSHTPSPHQSNMAAPPMVPQHSQQGTNSSTASANTSPNMNNNNNKRRRSTVKLEGDDGGGADGNTGANRVKPSPRMSKKAKPV